MMLSDILLPAGILGSMGVLFGAGLAFASQKLAVKVDERVAQVREALPGARIFPVSAATRKGFEPLLHAAADLLDRLPAPEPFY